MGEGTEGTSWWSSTVRPCVVESEAVLALGDPVCCLKVFNFNSVVVNVLQFLFCFCHVFLVGFYCVDPQWYQVAFVVSPLHLCHVVVGDLKVCQVLSNCVKVIVGGKSFNNKLVSYFCSCTVEVIRDFAEVKSFF